MPLDGLPFGSPIVAYTPASLAGSKTTEIPVPVTTWLHVLPPFAERHTPVVEVQITTWLLLGCTAIAPIRSRRNGPTMLVHVAPASVDFRIPAP